MSGHLPELDWKLFRKLREVALERFCERVLGEVAGIATDGATSWHDRYLKIYKLIERRDEELVRADEEPGRILLEEGEPLRLEDAGRVDELALDPAVVRRVLEAHVEVLVRAEELVAQG